MDDVNMEGAKADDVSTDDVQPEVTPPAEAEVATAAAMSARRFRAQAPAVRHNQARSAQAGRPKPDQTRQNQPRREGQKPQGQPGPRREDRPPRPEGRVGENRGGDNREKRGDRPGGDRRGDERRPGGGGERREGRPGGAGRPFDVAPDIELEKLISDSLYLDNQAHAVVVRMRDMDSGTKSQLRRLYNAVRRAVRAPRASASISSSCCGRAWRTPSRGIRCAAWMRSSACCCRSRAATTPAATSASKICSKRLSLTTNKRIMSTHTAQTQLQLVGKLILSGELHCETGLHIGAGRARSKSAARIIRW